MDLGSLRTLARDLNLTAHGVPITVLRPTQDADPIATRGIWASSFSQSVTSGMEFQRRDQVRVMAISRDVFATLPRGTIIQAPERVGSATVQWTVDGTDRIETDVIWVVVVPDVQLVS